jgi:hypothetical protein
MPLAWMHLFQRSKLREQRYALSEWIDEYREAYAGVPRSSTPQHPNVVECGKAIRQIGSNAIPTLVAWARDTTRFRHKGAYNRALAFWGFHILGEQANGAFPALVQLTKSPQREVRENVPEGLSSSAGMKHSGRSARYVFGVWTGIMVLSALASIAGNVFFIHAAPDVIAAITAVAAGAILCMLADRCEPDCRRIRPCRWCGWRFFCLSRTDRWRNESK